MEDLYKRDGKRSILTIKLQNPVPHALQKGTTTRLLDAMTLLLCLAEGRFENEVQRRRDDGEDDSPASETPSPADLVVELIGDLGTGKGSDNVRRGSEGECQASVLQLGRIGGDHVDGILHTTEADVVEDLGDGHVSEHTSNKVMHEALTYAVQ